MCANDRASFLPSSVDKEFTRYNVPSSKSPTAGADTNAPLSSSSSSWAAGTLDGAMNAPPLVGIREQRPHSGQRNSTNSSSGGGGGSSSSSSTNGSSNNKINHNHNHNARDNSRDRNRSSKSRAKSSANARYGNTDVDDFSQPGVVTFFKPGNYSRNIQEAPDKDRWHIPATDQAKWICLRLRP
jgi:hypothetical protein